jgi:hypothetical protein
MLGAEGKINLVEHVSGRSVIRESNGVNGMV